MACVYFFSVKLRGLLNPRALTTFSLLPKKYPADSFTFLVLSIATYSQMSNWYLPLITHVTCRANNTFLSKPFATLYIILSPPPPLPAPLLILSNLCLYSHPLSHTPLENCFLRLEPYCQFPSNGVFECPVCIDGPRSESQSLSGACYSG